MNYIIADITPLQGLECLILKLNSLSKMKYITEKAKPAEVASAPLVAFDVQPAVDYVTGLSHNSAYTNFNGESRALGSHVWDFVLLRTLKMQDKFLLLLSKE